MLQRRTNWKTPFSRMSPSSESFGCPLCHAKYTVVRRQSAPGIIPTCEACDQDFPPTENAEWLIYQREDA
jgi:transcription elongation factor Elf1